MFNPLDWFHLFHLFGHPPNAKPPGTELINYAIDPTTKRYVNVIGEDFFAKLSPEVQRHTVWNNILVEHGDLYGGFLAIGASEADVRAKAGLAAPQAEIESVKDLGAWPLDPTLHTWYVKWNIS
jgi:hypothetical protein